MKSFVVCFALLIGWMASPVFATTVTFEGLLPGAGSFYNGDSGIGNNANGWTADGVFFNNTFTDFGGGFTGWTGWSYSNIVDTATPGFGNQYASSTGGGANGVGGTNVGETYAIGFGDGAFFNVPSAMMVSSVDLTNTTYARLSMLTGDAFAKQFGGPSTNDPDFFRVTLTGFSAPGGSSGGGVTTGSVTVDLADYTFADNSNDFVLNTWQNVDLSSLGGAQSVGLTFASSDVGAFGVNTPTYVALDNLTLVAAVPEPSGFALMVLISSFALLRRKQRALC